MTNNTPFTFIHTADWHIGNSFARFDRDMRKKLNRAIFRAVEMIFRYAQKRNVPLLLCAGDAVDNGQLCAKEDLFKLFEIIKKYPDIQVVMIAGNHDPLLPQNIYSRVDKETYPDNLRFVSGDEEISFAEWNLKLFASSLRAKNGSQNPLDWVKEKELDKGTINIGLCHGSIENEAFPGNSFPIPPQFAEQQGLDYLALGDWHSYKKINSRTYYPGVPEPLQFGDEGYPLEVTISAPGQVPQVETVTGVGQYRWNQVEEIVGAESFGEFKSRLETVGDKEIRKLTLSGFLPVEKYKTYKELLDLNRHRYFDIRDNVVVQPDDRELIQAADGFMAEVVRRLLQLKQSGGPLPEDILNPYATAHQSEVYKQAETISREEIIDNALLTIYTYFKERQQ